MRGGGQRGRREESWQKRQTRETLAEKTGRTVRTVQRALDKSSGDGIIKKSDPARPDTGKYSDSRSLLAAGINEACCMKDVENGGGIVPCSKRTGGSG